MREDGEMERRQRDRDDHDLLVAHDVKFDQLFSEIKKTNGKLDKFIEKIDTKCDARVVAINKQFTNASNRTETKLPITQFQWIMGILITILTFVVIFVSQAVMQHIRVNSHLENNTIAITELTDDVEVIHFDVEANKDDIRDLRSNFIHIPSAEDED